MGGEGGTRAPAARLRFSVAVVVSAIVGLLGTSMTVAALWSEARASRDRAVEEVLDELAATAEVEVTDRLASLRSVRSMLLVSPELDADGFERFAVGVFAEEQAAGLLTLIWATSPTDDPLDAEITYLHTVGPSEGVVGLRLAGDPARTDELLRSMRERSAILSRPVPTDAGPRTEPLTEQVGPLLPMTLAVFDGDDLEGVVVAVYAARTVLASVAPDREFSVVDLGLDGAGEAVVLAGEPDPDGPFTRTEVLGRDWEVRLDRSEVPTGIPGRPIVAGVVGLIVTALVTTIVQQQALAHGQAEERAERLSGEATEAVRQVRLADERLRQGLRAAQIELWEREAESNTGWSTGGWRNDASPMFDEFMERVHPEDRHLIDRNGSRVLDEVVETEFRFRGGDGEYRWSLSRSVMVERDGRPVIIGVQMDVHARHQVREELERLNKLLKQSNSSLVEFTRVASHDLRSPMRTIGALVRFIREDARAPFGEVVDGHLAGIEQRVERQLQLLDDLLTYANSEEDATRREVDLTALVEGIAADFRTPDGPNVVVDVVAPDPVRLEQLPFATCVRNLIDNAVKHHDQAEFGTVLVTVRMRGAAVEVAVADDGPGIDPRYQLQIFEPFQRLSREVDGSGVGLAVVRRIAEQFGATIDLQSELGKGAVFLIFWPGQLVLSDAGLDLTDDVASDGGDEVIDVRRTSRRR